MIRWPVAVAAALLALAHAPAAAQSDSVAVAARDLPRGAVLEGRDIAYRAPAPGPTPGPAAPAVAAGWVTRRTIAAGEALRAPAVSPPMLVSTGQEVALVWSDGAMELRLKGRAMNSAVAGGRVAVRVDMKRRFEGVAIAAGLVRMDSPSRSR